MNRVEHLLTILGEECGEVAQRASKANRFGLNQVQDGQALTNAERIKYEMTDLLAMYDMLVKEGHLQPIKNVDFKLKQDKVERYLLLSKEEGCLQENVQCVIVGEISHGSNEFGIIMKVNEGDDNCKRCKHLHAPQDCDACMYCAANNDGRTYYR